MQQKKNPADTQCIVDLGRAEVASAFADLSLLQRWEVLRRCRKAMTARQLAESCGVEIGLAQRSLDRLIDAGLVDRVPAGRGRKQVSYRSVAPEVLFSWDPDVPAQAKLVADVLSGFRDLSRAILDRNAASEPDAGPPKPCFNAFATVTLRKDEVDRINRLLRAICEVLDAADMRAEARSAGTLAPEPADDGEWPYHLSLEQRPLRLSEPPIPHFELWDKRSVPRETERAKRAASQLLTARELAVAQRLASGESRPQIASALGLSINTIASTSKRVYTKLGVHTRADLATRLAVG